MNTSARGAASVALPSFAGDHSVPASAPELANSAADSIRLLNHATVIVDVSGGPESWPGYQAPADVASVVAWLTAAVRCLPQTLRQAEQWLTAANAAGLIGDDRTARFGVDVKASDTVVEACTDLRIAAGAAAHLACDLQLAHEVLAHLTVSGQDDGDSDAAPTHTHDVDSMDGDL